MNFDPRLREICRSHAYPLVFATISGAHLYGFPSPDSDYDLRGVHVLPVSEVVGLVEPRRTIEVSSNENDLDLDLVTHDVEKFFRLLLKRNGYVLEQLYSPLVVRTTDAHIELKSIAVGSITRHHSHHYLGFAETQWNLFQKEQPPRVKPLLYVYRVLLTGIHLMKTGVIEASLVTLNEEFRLPYISELVHLKMTSRENATLPSEQLEFHAAEYARLRGLLEQAREASTLPESPTCRDALNDLLLRIRLVS